MIAFIDSVCSKESFTQCSKELWMNENEIPDNVIDDDKNGYVDDIYGWNFKEGKGNVFSETKLNHCDYILQAFSETLGETKEMVNYEIMLLSILGTDGECTVEYLIDAIQYAYENGAKICNLSLSTYNDSFKLKEIIEKSEMLFVVAAGNEGENLDEGFPSYPTNYQSSNVISVAATNENDILLETSNYGKNVDVKMNGILRYGNETIEGTSIAAARVTAAILSRRE